MMLEVQYYFRSQCCDLVSRTSLVCVRGCKGRRWGGGRHSLPGQTFTRFILKVWLARLSKAVLPTLDGAALDVVQFVF